MASILSPFSKAVVLAALALLFTGASMAQAPDRPKPRQPTPQSVQQQEDVQTDANNSQSAADRKFREMDRRLNRTLRSVCIGC